MCKPLYNLILLHDSSYPTEAIEQQVKAKKEVHSFKLKHSQGSASNLRPQLANSTQRSMDLAQEKGASNWLTTLPIDENGFTLHKGAFRDATFLGTVGYHLTFPPPAHVESLSQLNTLSLVHWAAFHLYATMRSVI